MKDILPDSRAKVARGQIFASNGTWVPVFCANCGKDGGWTHENSTHMFYLCNNCVGTYGEIAGTMLVPDEVQWQRCQEAIANELGPQATETELLSILEEGASPLAKLLTLGR